MMSEGNISSDEPAFSPQNKVKEDKPEEDASDLEETPRSPTVIPPPPLIPAAHLISNLVPYALYHSLLPNVSSEGITNSFANPLLSSLSSLSSQQVATEEENEECSDIDESEPPLTHEATASPSPFQHFASKSVETAQIHNNESSTSTQKYSILNSLIGSSKNNSSVKNVENTDDNGEYLTSADGILI